MKKVLLVGRFNESFQKMNQDLSNFFTVQLCSDNLELFAGILKMSKPDAILISAKELGESHKELFALIGQKHGTIPVVCVGSKEELALVQTFPGCEEIKHVTTPTSVRNIVASINESLGISPRESSEKNITFRQPISRSMSAQRLRRKTVLLVDDAGVQLRAMEGMLKKDYDVKMATSGKEAIALIKKDCPDLILLDYNMPGCDGRETFELIQNEENGKDVPIVFVTGVNEKERIKEALKLKPEGYLVKPVKREELLETVRRVFEK